MKVPLIFFKSISAAALPHIAINRKQDDNKHLNKSYLSCNCKRKQKVNNFNLYILFVWFFTFLFYIIVFPNIPLAKKWVDHRTFSPPTNELKQTSKNVI